MFVCKIFFKNNGKKYFFSYEGLELNPGDFVVVETVRGLEVGRVFGVNLECPQELEENMKPVLRLATRKDLDSYEKNNAEKPKIEEEVKRLIKQNNLDMKLLDVDYTLDRQKLIINFEAEERIDFRQLVKDLAAAFKTRIELRQVGPRDSAKLLGGLGPCGYTMCCNSFIDDFENVSIKMAKNQNLSLNQQKISGNCGKLLCCLKFENELYEEMRVGMPDLNDLVQVEEGEGKVIGIDILKHEIRIKLLEDEKYMVVKLSDIKEIKSRKQRQQQ